MRKKNCCTYYKKLKLRVCSNDFFLVRTRWRGAWSEDQSKADHVIFRVKNFYYLSTERKTDREELVFYLFIFTEIWPKQSRWELRAVAGKLLWYRIERWLRLIMMIGREKAKPCLNCMKTYAIENRLNTTYVWAARPVYRMAAEMDRLSTSLQFWYIGLERTVRVTLSLPFQNQVTSNFTR